MAEITVKLDLTQELINKVAGRLAEYGDVQLVTRCIDCVYFSENKTIGTCRKYDSFVPHYNYCGLAKMKQNET